MLTVLQRHFYYPFGMRFDGIEPVNTTNENLYQYNGKELTKDFGIDWYNYGARWYDAAAARWNAVDPLAEKYAEWSAYNYTLDNPVRFFDPDGMSAEDIIIQGFDGSSFNWTPGTTYDGDDVFIQQTVLALNALTVDPNTAHYSFLGRETSGVNLEGNAILDYAAGGIKDYKDIFIKHADFNPISPGEDQHITGTIYWDPTLGVKEEGFNGKVGGGAFPSMGLLIHEFGHAVLYHEFGGEDWQDREYIFPDEEQMIIDRLEKPAMQSLGFGYRHTHIIYDNRNDLLNNGFPYQSKAGKPFRGAYYIKSFTPTKLEK